MFQTNTKRKKKNKMQKRDKMGRFVSTKKTTVKKTAKKTTMKKTAKKTAKKSK